jgi:hypothetical protein
MQISRFTPSFLIVSTLTVGIALNSVKLAQGANLVSDSTNDFEPLLELSFDLAPDEADRTNALLNIVAQHLPDAKIDATDLTPGKTASAPPSPNNNSPSLLQNLATNLKQIKWFYKIIWIEPLKDLPQTAGTDLNEGIYSSSSRKSIPSSSGFENPFSEKTSVFDNPFLEKTSVLTGLSPAKTVIFNNPFITGDSQLVNNPFEIGQIGIRTFSAPTLQGINLNRQASVGASRIQPARSSNNDVEFNLLPAIEFITRLKSYRTDLSSTVSELDSKFALKIKTEFRLLPDPILLSVSNLELEDFGTSKLTEYRQMSIYSVQEKLATSAQEKTEEIQGKLAERERKRYKKWLKNNSAATSGDVSSSAPRQNPLVSTQSPLYSTPSSTSVSYAPGARPATNFSNPAVSPLPRPLLSTPNLSPQSLKTLPKSF